MLEENLMVETEDISVLSSQVLCNICYEEIIPYPLVDVKGWWDGCQNSSNHSHFCKPCLEAYVTMTIKESNFSKDGKITCPCADRCGAIMPDESIEQMVTSSEFLKYKLFSNRRLVESNPSCFFCPNPECGDRQLGGTVIDMTNKSFGWRITCDKCHISICKKCRQHHGLFVSCEGNLGSEFTKWKYHTTQGCKRCPKCKMYIEKNEGCNHMTCSRCSHQFCWKCLGDWNGGCKRPWKLCDMIHVSNMNLWGSNIFVRTATKSLAAIGVLPITATVIGVGSAGVGIAGACAIACGAAAIPAAVVAGTYRFGQQMYYRVTNGEYKVTVMLPWRKNAEWVTRVGSDDSPVCQFLGYTGRMHKSGILVVRTKIDSQNGIEQQSLKEWFKYGPQPVGGDCDVVIYFIPRCTPRENITPIIPDFDNLAKAAYPASTWEKDLSEVTKTSYQQNLEYYIVRALNSFARDGNGRSKGPPRGIIDDDTEYTVPVDPDEPMLKTSIINDFTFLKCKICNTPKYYTSEDSYQQHMIEAHNDWSLSNQEPVPIVLE